MTYIYKLTPSNLQQIISLPIPTSWCWVDNPTGSPVLGRLGSTDSPLEGSADIFVASLSTIVFPTSGARDFVFTWDLPDSLGSPIPQTTANIVIGNNNEKPPVFGSASQNKQQYYDRPNFNLVTTMVGQSQVVTGPISGHQNNTYTVGKGKKAIITGASQRITRKIAATTPGIQTQFIELSTIPGFAGTIQLSASGIYFFNNTVNTISERDNTFQTPLLEGATVATAINSTDSNDGNVIFSIDIYIYEFNA